MNGLTKEPDFFPRKEMAKFDWGINLSNVAGKKGSKYHIPQALIDKAKDNSLILAVFKTNLTNARKYTADLVKNKDSIMELNPTNTNLPVTLTLPPDIQVWPENVTATVGLLRPHMEIASLLLANSDLTAADKTEFGLDKQPTTPSTRPTAEDFNYPFMGATVKNNTIELRIKRGKRFAKKMCKVFIDKSGNGNFTPYTTTVAAKITIPIELPANAIAAAVVFKAVYLDGNEEKSDWSPNLVVPVQRSNAPTVAPQEGE